MTGSDDLAASLLAALLTRAEALETRLRGSPSSIYEIHNHQAQSEGVSEQLNRLQHSWQNLLARSDEARSLIELHRIHRGLPDKLQDVDSDPRSVITQLVSLKQSATIIRGTASDLAVLREQKVPSTELTCDLLSQGPRLHELVVRQQETEIEVSALLRRTASLLQQVRSSKLREAEQWASWEQRLKRLEHQVITAVHEGGL